MRNISCEVISLATQDQLLISLQTLIAIERGVSVIYIRDF